MQLLTTIPIAFSRQVDGVEQGPSYLARCIASWRDNGFTVKSVNRPQEVEHASRLAPDVEIVVSDVDDALFPGRLGASFGALFAAAPKDEPFGIVNSDIYMVRSPTLAAEIGRLAVTNLVFAGRTEFSASIGRYNPRKIDFVVLDPRAVREAVEHPFLRKLQLGVPWWSWAFPIAASFGGPVTYIERPFLFHMEHFNRWGNEAMEATREHTLEALLQVAALAHTEAARTFQARYLSLQSPLERHKMCADWLFGEDGAKPQPYRVSPRRDPLLQSVAGRRYRFRILWERVVSLLRRLLPSS